MLLSTYIYKPKKIYLLIILIPFYVYCIHILTLDITNFGIKHLFIIPIFLLIVDGLWQLFGKFQIDFYFDKIVIKMNIIGLQFYQKTINILNIIKINKIEKCERKHIMIKGFGSWELYFNYCLNFELVSNKSYQIEVINEKICDEIISNFNKVKK